MLATLKQKTLRIALWLGVFNLISSVSDTFGQQPVPIQDFNPMQAKTRQTIPIPHVTNSVIDGSSNPDAKSRAALFPSPIQTLQPTRQKAPTGEVYYTQAVLPPTKGLEADSTAAVAASAVLRYLMIHNNLPIHNADDWAVSQILRDTLKNSSGEARTFTHIRLQQQWAGIDVYGAELLLHFERDSFYLLNGRYAPATQHFATPNAALSAESALTIAEADLCARTKCNALTDFERELLAYPTPSIKQVYYMPVAEVLPATLPLSYIIEIRPNFVERWQYCIDAHSGAIIHALDLTCPLGPATATATDLNSKIQTIQTFQTATNAFALVNATKPMYKGAATSYKMGDGIIITYDMRNTNSSASLVTSTDNRWNERSSVSAHVNASIAYDYYRTVHNRNSIDGRGGDILSFVNVSDQQGRSLANAYWNGRGMYYGNGGSVFKPLAGSLDVAGHEMTHGVIQHTANLRYEFQSGSLNESFADVFGCMLDTTDWQIGEDVAQRTYFPSGALRDMQNPANGCSRGASCWQPRKMSEFQNMSANQDNGGVHKNSGIPNHAYYLIATAITRKKAEQIYYRALTRYLTASSQFIDMRLAAVAAGTDIHGANSVEVKAIKDAFDTVEIFDGESTTKADTLPAVEGTHFVLGHGASGDRGHTLHRVTPQAAFRQGSVVGYRKASVTEDGSTAYYVSVDSTIRRIRLDIANPVEETVDSRKIWNNVAVNRNGRLLAATTAAKDTSIYLLELEAQRWTRFRLYNPTFSEGVQSGGPVFADQFEWDHSGERLIYDAENNIRTTFGQNINYWDVGFIRLWNTVKDTLGDGVITKLFASLPAGISLGNATFSKNNPNLIAYDYIDFNYRRLQIYTHNIETGKNGLVFNNALLGHPTFSPKDDYLAFTSLSGPVDTIIAFLPLRADKMAASGNAVGFARRQKWANWFAMGTRRLEARIRFAGDSTFCPGDSIRLIANGSAGATFRWLVDGVEIAGARDSVLIVKRGGRYRARLIYAGARDTLTPTLTASERPAPPVPVITRIQNTLSTDAAPPVRWFRGSTRLPETGTTLTTVTAGSYRVEKEGSNGCISRSETFTYEPIRDLRIELTPSGANHDRCVGDSLTLSIRLYEPAEIAWERSGNILSGETSAILVVKQNGVYRARVRFAGLPDTFTRTVLVSFHPKPENPILRRINNTLVISNFNPTQRYTWYINRAELFTNSDSAFTPIEEGNYSVVASNRWGCYSGTTAAAFTPINASARLQADGATEFCEGSSVLLRASSTNNRRPIAYRWLRDSIQLDATTDTLRVTQSGQYAAVLTYGADTIRVDTMSNAISVRVRPAPPVPVLTFENGALLSSAPSGNRWYRNGGQIPGATGTRLIPIDTGHYTVQIANEFGCRSSSAPYPYFPQITARTYTGIDSAKLYPNPANFMAYLELSFQFPVTQAVLRITDLNGRVVQIQHLGYIRSGQNRLTIDATDIPAGLYSLTLTTAEGVFYYQKLAVQH